MKRPPNLSARASWTAKELPSWTVRLGDGADEEDRGVADAPGGCGGAEQAGGVKLAQPDQGGIQTWTHRSSLNLEPARGHFFERRAPRGRIGLRNATTSETTRRHAWKKTITLNSSLLLKSFSGREVHQLVRREARQRKSTDSGTQPPALGLNTPYQSQAEATRRCDPRPDTVAACPNLWRGSWVSTVHAPSVCQIGAYEVRPIGAVDRRRCLGLLENDAVPLERYDSCTVGPSDRLTCPQWTESKHLLVDSSLSFVRWFEEGLYFVSTVSSRYKASKLPIRRATYQECTKIGHAILVQVHTSFSRGPSSLIICSACRAATRRVDSPTFTLSL